MKFEIRKVTNGAILRVETDAPDESLDTRRTVLRAVFPGETGEEMARLGRHGPTG